VGGEEIDEPERCALAPAAAIIAGTGNPVSGSMMASAAPLAGVPSGSSLSFMVSRRS
jgi:hypothetical protein